MEAFEGAIGAIAGAIVGWGLSEIARILSDRRKAIKDLKIAGFACLDRLLKIQHAKSCSDDRLMNHEINLLGQDLDHYRNCIARNLKIQKMHWSIYRRIIPILLKHDLSILDQVISDLESVFMVD